MEYVQVLAALGGVLLGGVLSLIGTIRVARTSWERDKSKHLMEIRMAAYSQFARAIKEETRICVAVAASRGVGPTDSPLDEAAGRDQLTIARRERSDRLEDLWIVGEEAVVDASRRWHGAVRDLRTGVFAPSPLSRADFDSLYGACNSARTTYYSATRADLEVHGAVPAL